jgi:hypothetical protein
MFVVENFFGNFAHQDLNLEENQLEFAIKKFQFDDPPAPPKRIDNWNCCLF